MALFSVVPFFVYSQNPLITGHVKDSLNQPVSYAVVTSVDKNDTDKTLSYTQTEVNGAFKLKIPQTYIKDSVILKVRHISHEMMQLKVAIESQNLNILLKSKKNLLDEVVLKAQKTVRIKGDTIIYNVNRLKRKKDYTIEEVINRIPGVKITENGQILYKDKAISHLYINDVDLLEGKYNIATRGIPANAVENIEVLQRHHHARIDIGKTESEDVAFNLKIKKDRSLIFGSSRADVGTPLLTARADVTPIYLKEKFQDIASLRINNIGKSLKDYGNNLVQGNRLINALKISSANLLSKPNVSGNTISSKYWLDNESLAITNDALFKKNDENLLKASVSYSYDESTLEQDYKSLFYSENDCTYVNRKSYNRLKEKHFKSGIVQEINKSKFYLKNKLSITGSNTDGVIDVVQNNVPIVSNYDLNERQLLNITNIKTNLGDKVLNSGSVIQIVDNKEILNVVPAVFNDEIANTFSANTTDQELDIKQFNLGAYAAFDFDISNTKWDFMQNITYKNESLKSDLILKNTNDQTQPDFPFKGDFNVKSLTTFTSLSSSYRWKRFKLKITPKFTFLNLNVDEKLSKTNNFNNNYFFLTPNASLSYQYKNSWDFGLSGSKSINTSKFPELYNGVIMKSFSNLSRQPRQVDVKKINKATFFWAYNDILKGFFFKSNISYQHIKSDYTFSSTIDDKGLINTTAVDRPNIGKMWSSSTSLSKRFFKIVKTEFRYNFNKMSLEQFFNNSFQENENTQHAIQLELNIDNNTWYGINYEVLLNYGISDLNEIKTSNRFFKHDLTLDFYTSSKTRFRLGMETAISTFSNSSNRNQNTLFNGSFYYKPTKKLFIRTSLLNIFNEDFFSRSSSNSNFVSQSRFSLRPRQFTIGLNYSL